MNVGGFGMSFVGEREREKRELYPMMVIKSNHFLTINLKKNAVPIYIYNQQNLSECRGDIYIYISMLNVLLSILPLFFFSRRNNLFFFSSC